MWKIRNAVPHAENWIFYLVLASVLTALIGARFMRNTVMVNRDASKLINQARQFDSDLNQAVTFSWPGYPFLIHTTYNLANPWTNIDDDQLWIYSGQLVSLGSRILVIWVLFAIAKTITTKKRALWSVLIIAMLPHPAMFGSEVIREWPHLLFLASAMALLAYGLKKSSTLLMALAGAAAALGHAVRPEAAQVVIFGVIILLSYLIYTPKNLSRAKCLRLMAAIVLGFAALAGPYMALRQQVLPTKLREVITAGSEQADLHYPGSLANAGFDHSLGSAALELVGQISDNYMHFFLLPALIGAYVHFRKIRLSALDHRALIPMLIVTYTAMMLLLYVNYGYITRRHCMPMAIFGAMYIPTGAAFIARYLSHKLYRTYHRKNASACFLVIMMIGLAMCCGKMNRMIPLRPYRQGYLTAAQWLKQNTEPNAVIAAPDVRISFYAGREHLCSQLKIPAGADYFVQTADYAHTRHIPEHALAVYKQQKTGNPRYENITVYRLQEPPARR